MKTQVKDRDTVPWISPSEIPAVKVMLSAWRKLRKDKERVKELKEDVDDEEDLNSVVSDVSKLIAEAMVALSYAEESIKRSEHDKGRRT